ncbi:MAG: CRISPR-associated endonuclease Cas6, partial [Thermodesulfovibrionales bacterium]
MEINILKLNLMVESDLTKSDAEKIRGYLGNLFWDNPYVHQHEKNGSLIYRYPRVQYKIINRSCVLIGFNEGLDIIKKKFYDLKEINLGGIWHEILSKGLESYTVSFSIISEQQTQTYSFLTPWLALNEKNYEQYQKLGTWAKKKELLEKTLIGNIISVSKSLGYTVPEPIKANISSMKEVQTKLKGIPMLGFLGKFSVNFEIPDYL